MKNKVIKFIISSLIIYSLFILVSCGTNEVNSDVVELTIYNCEDYISTGDDCVRDLIAEFEELYNCKVNYYTYDTNETMYNQFTLQKEGTYDLICTSEYMIQKMIKNDLVIPLEDIEHNIPNYYNYCSPFLKDKIHSTTNVKNDGKDYAVGYMWGTLGLLYDSEYTDTICDDVYSWDILWDSKYKNTISIKNSIRDTFVCGLMHHYSKEESFISIMNDYLACEDTKDVNAYNRYNSLIQEIFDFKLDGSEESNNDNLLKIQNVKEELISVKNNLFGLETDSGKSDIVTGKIKINLAWSGDAVYSIDTAREQSGKALEYVVPLDGGNIWFDGWTIPKGGNVELAYKFLDFMSAPENAAENMDYIGYTTYIVGDPIFDLACWKYGASEFIEGVEYCCNKLVDEETGEFVIDEETSEFVQEYPAQLVIYNNKLYKCLYDTDGEILPDNEEYFECMEFEVGKDYKEGEMISFNSSLYYVLEDGQYSSINSFEEVKSYDVNYLFEGTLSEGRTGIIYPYYGYYNQLETQYPSEFITARCAIMNDFGVFNDNVVIMWGQFRAYTNMTPVYIILGVSVSLVIVFIVIISIKNYKHKTFKKNLLKKY